MTRKQRHCTKIDNKSQQPQWETLLFAAIEGAEPNRRQFRAAPELPDLHFPDPAFIAGIQLNAFLPRIAERVALMLMKVMGGHQ